MTMDDFNPLNEAHVASSRAAVAEAIAGLRSGELPFVEAVRAISAHRFRLPGALDNPDFLFFAAMDSQTDHLPSASMRSRCSQSWLNACDREASEVARTHADAVSSACDGIFLALGEPL
jgi:hypothetical protein